MAHHTPSKVSDCRFYGFLALLRPDLTTIRARFPLDKTSCTFGRKRKVDVRIQVPECSSSHARIRIDSENQATIEVYGRNGLLLNGEPLLPAANTPDDEQPRHLLVDGATINIAGRNFRWEACEPAEALEEVLSCIPPTPATARKPRMSLINRAVVWATPARPQPLGIPAAPPGSTLSTPSRVPISPAKPGSRRSARLSLSGRGTPLPAEEPGSISSASQPDTAEDHEQRSILVGILEEAEAEEEERLGSCDVISIDGGCEPAARPEDELSSEGEEVHDQAEDQAVPSVLPETPVQRSSGPARPLLRTPRTAQKPYRTRKDERRRSLRMIISPQASPIAWTSGTTAVRHGPEGAKSCISLETPLQNDLSPSFQAAPDLTPNSASIIATHCAASPISKTSRRLSAMLVPGLPAESPSHDRSDESSSSDGAEPNEGDEIESDECEGIAGEPWVGTPVCRGGLESSFARRDEPAETLGGCNEPEEAADRTPPQSIIQDHPDGSSSTTQQPNSRTPSRPSLARRKSLREKVLIRSAVKAHFGSRGSSEETESRQSQGEAAAATEAAEAESRAFDEEAVPRKDASANVDEEVFVDDGLHLEDTMSEFEDDEDEDEDEQVDGQTEAGADAEAALASAYGGEDKAIEQRKEEAAEEAGEAHGRGEQGPDSDHDGENDDGDEEANDTFEGHINLVRAHVPPEVAHGDCFAQTITPARIMSATRRRSFRQSARSVGAEPAATPEPQLHFTDRIIRTPRSVLVPRRRSIARLSGSFTTGLSHAQRQGAQTCIAAGKKRRRLTVRFDEQVACLEFEKLPEETSRQGAKRMCMMKENAPDEPKDPAPPYSDRLEALSPAPEPYPAPSEVPITPEGKIAGPARVQSTRRQTALRRTSERVAAAVAPAPMPFEETPVRDQSRLFVMGATEPRPLTFHPPKAFPRPPATLDYIKQRLARLRRQSLPIKPEGWSVDASSWTPLPVASEQAPELTPGSPRHSAGSARPTLDVSSNRLLARGLEPATPALSGFRQLFSQPTAQAQTPILSGVKNLFATSGAPAQTPAMSGVRDLFAEPKPTNTASYAGVRSLLSSVPQTKTFSPDLAGVKEMTMPPRPAPATPRFGGLRQLFGLQKPTPMSTEALNDGMTLLECTPEEPDGEIEDAKEEERGITDTAPVQSEQNEEPDVTPTEEQVPVPAARRLQTMGRCSRSQSSSPAPTADETSGRAPAAPTAPLKSTIPTRATRTRASKDTTPTTVKPGLGSSTGPARGKAVNEAKEPETGQQVDRSSSNTPLPGPCRIPRGRARVSQQADGPVTVAGEASDSQPVQLGTAGENPAPTRKPGLRTLGRVPSQSKAEPKAAGTASAPAKATRVKATQPKQDATPAPARANGRLTRARTVSAEITGGQDSSDKVSRPASVKKVTGSGRKAAAAPAGDHVAGRALRSRK